MFIRYPSLEILTIKLYQIRNTLESMIMIMSNMIMQGQATRIILLFTALVLLSTLRQFTAAFPGGVMKHHLHRHNNNSNSDNSPIASTTLDADDDDDTKHDSGSSTLGVTDPILSLEGCSVMRNSKTMDPEIQTISDESLVMTMEGWGLLVEYVKKDLGIHGQCVMYWLFVFGGALLELG